MRRAPNGGVSLVNVLVVVAASASLVHVMLSGQEGAVDRLALANDMAQAGALAEGGVRSVAVALRRDLQDGPDSDHLAEPWAAAMQSRITVDGGEFEISIEDARGRFDLNALTPTSLAEQRIFTGLLGALDLPGTLAPMVTRAVQTAGPLDDPADLLSQGLSEADLATLAPHVTALPTLAPINLNSASEPVLAAVFANSVAARGLAARRAAKGYVELSDLAALGLALPPVAGFRSDTFDVVATATVGEARRVLVRRLVRDRDSDTVTSLPGG